jgi:rhodanese-related sulfurtransferase
MTKQQFSTIDRDDLEERIEAHSLNNQDRHRGFALVNVLGEGAFAMAHIPGSINIPHGKEDVFERRFAKDKEIIVYCASPDCPTSDNVAAVLVTRGFRRVYDYAGGQRLATRRIPDRFVAFDRRRTYAATSIVSGEAGPHSTAMDAPF